MEIKLRHGLMFGHATAGMNNTVFLEVSSGRYTRGVHAALLGCILMLVTALLRQSYVTAVVAVSCQSAVSQLTNCRAI